MHIQQFLKKTGMPNAELSRRLGICTLTLRKIILGSDVKMAIVKRIEEVTDGQVTFSDLYESFKQRNNNENTST
jgi:predicted transcriptional regulator